jgi:hypothetical protein
MYPLKSVKILFIVQQTFTFILFKIENNGWSIFTEKALFQDLLLNFGQKKNNNKNCNPSLRVF